MRKILQDALFSFNGVAITIGVVGVMSGLVQLFIDVNARISVKWLLFALLVAFIVTIILLKLVHDLHEVAVGPAPFETPIQYSVEAEVFLIRRNDAFANSFIVGLYVEQGELERLAYLGSVHLVQERVIQIKILQDCGTLPSIPTNAFELKNLRVRPGVPKDVFERLYTPENT